MKTYIKLIKANKIEALLGFMVIGLMFVFVGLFMLILNTLNY